MPQKKKILIVDDDEAMGDVLGDILTTEGYYVQWVGNGPHAIEIFNENTIDIVLLDLLLPGMNGIEVLKQIIRVNPTSTVIMMSGHGTIQTAVQAVRLGAYDWLEKPLEKERVLLTVRNAIEKSTILKEKEFLLAEVKERYRMVGTSPAMKKVYQLIDKVASTKTTVLITGESGSGKQLVARAIHINSQRSSCPFVQVNCAAIPETLIESELFGHVKGAFTGAYTDKQGKFQLADGGTLFLDEIGDLSPTAQAKVLRSIETGEVTKVGTETVDQTDMRLISATNKNLDEMVRKRSFRNDLYHRINVVTINIPPLRKRPNDILPLTNFFLDMSSTQNNIEKKVLTPSAETVLLSYSWPGNIRELRNISEKITVLVDAKEVNGSQVEHLLNLPKLEIGPFQTKTFKQAKKSFEKSYILHALTSNKWNATETAKALDIPRSLLYKKIEMYGIKGRS